MLSSKNSADQAYLIRGLLVTDYAGVSGRARFDANGFSTRKVLGMRAVKDGWEELTPGASDTAAAAAYARSGLIRYR
jgi:hypothetical protein